MEEVKRSELKAILKAKPTEDQLAYNGEPSLKAARVLGEKKLATKSATGLDIFGNNNGLSDEEAVRRANENLINEREHRKSIIHAQVESSLGKPTKEQLDYPPLAKLHPVSIKALGILGDEELEMKAKQEILTIPNLKAMKILGSAGALAPLKARKVLGSTEDDGEARLLANKHWIEEMTKRTEQFTKEVLSQKPDDYMTSIPLGQGPVAEKALSFFGDEELKKKSLRAVKIRAPPKAIKFLGEASLAGHKAEELTGSLTDNFLHGKRKRSTGASKSPLQKYRNYFFSNIVGEVY